MTLLTFLYFVFSIIIVLCFLAVLSSVFIDFVKFDKKEGEKRKKKSMVATGSMLVFFIFFYLAIRFRVGEIKIENASLQIFLSIVGLLLIVLGTYVNIKGRFNLGENWANHIKIYDNHKLITSGVYKIVRHPLYGSLIWAFFGASFAYSNYVAFLLNAFIFIPIMYYRAKQEENLLEKEFPEYKNYKLKVGMFFPKISK